MRENRPIIALDFASRTEVQTFLEQFPSQEKLFVKVGMEVRGYIINVQNGDMDDELEADLYDKLTKLTADDIQEVVNAIDN